jgi:hypothetical protein
MKEKMAKSEKDIQNNILTTSPALAIIHEWLSVSESQICSTEVLSEQLPKVNELLETSMNNITSHFGKISENSKKIAKEIQHIDEAIDSITIGGKSVDIVSHIEGLSAATSDRNTAKSLLELAEKIKAQENSIHAELKEALSIIKANSAEISEVVVGMQFQDRVSQNILITVNVMKTIVKYLEKEINHSLPQMRSEEKRKLLDKDFAKQILQQFRLGELQLSFVNHLIEHGYIEDASELDFSIEAHEKKKEDDGGDVDLF